LGFDITQFWVRTGAVYGTEIPRFGQSGIR